MKKVILIIGGFIGILLIYGFFQKDHSEYESHVQRVVVDEVHHPSDMSEHVFSTIVRNSDDAVIFAQVAGEMKNITVNEGDAVQHGQTIGYINAGEYAAQYRQAQSMVQIAEEQEKLARRKWNDYKPEEREQIKLEVDRSRAVLSETAAYLAKSKIVAPFSGTIATKFISVGSSVRPGDAVVRIIGNADKKEVAFDVLQDVGDSVSVGDVLHVKNESRNSDATVYAINPVADEQTRKISIRAYLNDSNIFNTGEFVDVHMQVNAVTADGMIPLSSLVRFYDDYVVFVVDGNVARMVRVDVVNVDGKSATVNNIELGDVVIVKGAHLLDDGDEINIVTEKE